MEQKSYLYNLQTRTQNYFQSRMPEYHHNNINTNFADPNLSKQVQTDIRYTVEDLDGLANLEPIYKAVNINGKLAIVKQTVVKVTKVTRVTKVTCKTYANVKNTKSEPVSGHNIDLERAKALKPTLYKLLKTLKNPESIKKIQQAIASFDKMELEAAANKLQQSFAQQAKPTLRLKENLDVMSNFVNGQHSKLNEEPNLLFFQHVNSLDKMIEDAKREIKI